MPFPECGCFSGEALELSSLGMLPGLAESIPFKEMINEAREDFKNTSTSNHLVITEDENFPQVYFDRTGMLDVLISMIEGCIRYSGERGSHIVHVGWCKQDDGPVFFTSCSGTGELKDLSQAFGLSSEEESADNSTSIVFAISKMS